MKAKAYSKLNQIEEGLPVAAAVVDEESAPSPEDSKSRGFNCQRASAAWDDGESETDAPTLSEKVPGSGIFIFRVGGPGVAAAQPARESLEISHPFWTQSSQRHDDDDVDSVEPTVSDLPPPPGVRPDGVWGYSTHFGESTRFSSIMCCLIGIVVLIGGCIPVCIHCCLPFDRRRVFKSSSGICYDAKGIPLGRVSGFRTGEPDDPIDQENRTLVHIFSGSLILLTFFPLGTFLWQGLFLIHP